jgi:lipoate-protein ligase A
MQKNKVCHWVHLFLSSNPSKTSKTFKTPKTSKTPKTPHPLSHAQNPSITPTSSLDLSTRTNSTSVLSQGSVT